MTLKEEFEQAFNYKIGSAKDDWDSVIQVDAEGLWKWIEQKVSRVELPVKPACENCKIEDDCSIRKILSGETAKTFSCNRYVSKSV